MPLLFLLRNTSHKGILVMAKVINSLLLLSSTIFFFTTIQCMDHHQYIGPFDKLMLERHVAENGYQDTIQIVNNHQFRTYQRDLRGSQYIDTPFTVKLDYIEKDDSTLSKEFFQLKDKSYKLPGCNSLNIDYCTTWKPLKTPHRFSITTEFYNKQTLLTALKPFEK
jgi:hypothetical protein